jgi:hypothetical protein
MSRATRSPSLRFKIPVAAIKMADEGTSSSTPPPTAATVEALFTDDWAVMQAATTCS